MVAAGWLVEAASTRNQATPTVGAEQLALTHHKK
jgi:hypothetical protein